MKTFKEWISIWNLKGRMFSVTNEEDFINGAEFAWDYKEKLDLIKTAQINSLKNKLKTLEEAFDTKTRVHDKLNKDYIKLRDSVIL